MTMTPKEVMTHYGFTQPEYAGSDVIIGIVNMKGTVSAADLKTLSKDLKLTNDIQWKQANTEPISDSSTAEILVDMAVIGSCCPDAIIIVYQAGHAAHSTQSYVNAFTDIINMAVTDGCQVISSSFGAPEQSPYSGAQTIKTSSLGNFNSAVQKAKNNDVVICAAAGDTGSDADGDYEFTTAAKNNINFPCGHPDILAIGGTTINNGTESAWGGGGGGMSAIYTNVPDYQKLNGFPTNTITDAMVPQLSPPGKPKAVILKTKGRVVPDVAALATGWDVSTPLKSFTAPPGINWSSIDGTSLSTPFWASIIAWCIQQYGRSISDIHTKLYYSVLNNTDKSKSITTDISTGNNNYKNMAIYFEAAIGFDACTGLGVPNNHLLDELMTWNKPHGTFT